MNPIRKALGAAAATIGSWYGIRCNLIPERFGAVGFDWVIVVHSPIAATGRNTLSGASDRT